MYMAKFKFKFIYKCIIICIDCFVVNTNFILQKKCVLLMNDKVWFTVQQPSFYSPQHYQRGIYFNRLNSLTEKIKP